MNYRYCCVIDQENMYRFAAIVISVQAPDGTARDVVKDYVLQDGESLVDTTPPDMVKARWTSTEWEEVATPDELAAYKATQQALFH